jgi:hypothetical protein
VIRRILPVLTCLACAILYGSAVNGYFLSDDMAVIHSLAEWRDQGEYWARLFARFGSGLDTPSHYYRPLTYLSYGLNFAGTGLDPLSWHLVNLAGHFAAGAGVYRITSLLRPGGGPRFDAWFAASLFLLCGTNAEAVAWISGRYDVFATAFTLWAVALYLRAGSGMDARMLGAVLCGLLALASKESGAVAPGVIACFAWVKHGALPGRARWRAIVRDLAPWIILLAGYILLRLVVFGSILQVYPGAHPLARLSAGDWLLAVRGMPAWLAVALPDRGALAAGGVLLAALVAVALLATVRDRSIWRSAAGTFAAIVWSLALLLPHLSGLSASGEGGRLFYTTCALASILLGLPFGSGATDRTPNLLPRALTFLGLAVVVANGVLLDAALGDWRSAGTQMRRLLAPLPGLYESMREDEFVILIAPDAVGSVPFARNANGAMVVRPIQPRTLVSKMIVFLPEDVPSIPAKLGQQLIPRLKQYAVDKASQKLAAEVEDRLNVPSMWPSRVQCWRRESSAWATLELPEGWRDPARWRAEARQGLLREGCGPSP